MAFRRSGVRLPLAPPRPLRLPAASPCRLTIGSVGRPLERDGGLQARGWAGGLRGLLLAKKLAVGQRLSRLFPELQITPLRSAVCFPKVIGADANVFFGGDRHGAGSFVQVQSREAQLIGVDGVSTSARNVRGRELCNLRTKQTSCFLRRRFGGGETAGIGTAADAGRPAIVWLRRLSGVPVFSGRDVAVWDGARKRRNFNRGCMLMDADKISGAVGGAYPLPDRLAIAVAARVTSAFPAACACCRSTTGSAPLRTSPRSKTSRWPRRDRLRRQLSCRG